MDVGVLGVRQLVLLENAVKWRFPETRRAKQTEPSLLGARPDNNAGGGGSLAHGVKTPKGTAPTSARSPSS